MASALYLPNRRAARVVTYPRPRKPGEVAAIIEAACQRYGVSREDLLHMKGRKYAVTGKARAWACREIYLTGRSLLEVARYLGLHHTTVLHHCRDIMRVAPDLSGEWI